MGITIATGIVATPGSGGSTPGPQGPPGPEGLPGLDGEEGQPGPPGAQGGPGPTGNTGNPGPVGPPGADGTDGVDGQPGAMGPQGPAGSNGQAGATGPTGANGIDGIDGEDGQPGTPGPQGPAGSNGQAGAAGSVGPPGMDGELSQDDIIVPHTRLTVEDEGVVISNQVERINFTGAGVSAAATGNEVAVTISGGGGGGASATTVEVNLGSTVIWQGRFTITDAAIGATSKVMCWQAPGPYTGKGSALSSDEGTLDPIIVSAVIPATGSAVAYWETKGHYAPVHRRQENGAGRTIASVDGEVEAAEVLAAPAGGRSSKRIGDIVAMQRIGKVKGNIKFSYVVFS